MTYPENGTPSAPLLELLTQNGLDALPHALTVLLNAAMQAERQKHLGLAPYERSPEH